MVFISCRFDMPWSIFSVPAPLIVFVIGPCTSRDNSYCMLPLLYSVIFALLEVFFTFLKAVLPRIICGVPTKVLISTRGLFPLKAFSLLLSFIFICAWLLTLCHNPSPLSGLGTDSSIKLRYCRRGSAWTFRFHLLTLWFLYCVIFYCFNFYIPDEVKQTRQFTLCKVLKIFLSVDSFSVVLGKYLKMFITKAKLLRQWDLLYYQNVNAPASAWICVWYVNFTGISYCYFCIHLSVFGLRESVMFLTFVYIIFAFDDLHYYLTAELFYF